MGHRGQCPEDARHCYDKQQQQIVMDLWPVRAQMEWGGDEEDKGLGAQSVLMKPDAIRQGSPASGMERHTCWLSGTMKPTSSRTGTQTESASLLIKRCTRSSGMSA